MLTYIVSVAAAVAAISVLTADAHSWLECTDYDTATAGSATWDKKQCNGFARCGDRQMGAGFGVDTGFNAEKKTCQCAYGSDAGKNIPTATYTPGQRVCLAYPPKNHVADTCTGPYIPDNGVTITRTAVGATTDDFSGKSYAHLNGVHVNGVVDHKGFQNCPSFCSDKDKALCTMCFDLEADIAPGKYSFMWQWEFNAGQFYSTCWEAVVSGTARLVTSSAGGAPTKGPASTLWGSSAAPSSSSPAGTTNSS
ncbi:hypothetical protein ACHHYP_06668, partial [Achlya hypogyna]